ncbi:MULTISPECIES: TonB-dependent siderophore receptor [unclassified Flavobacterium]|uniref:TonB-dependent receptor plug domain-containing protein n=1 Tax=unclassified Flavobacterium TaxID=196869 RepID=UPI001F140A6E|nr:MULTISPECIES: TonB-dependent receptor [unclassified Flavobacterium]UMY67131.1 TonB-dependent receptor [Flavobacterium sp. HJ-32-4]
MKQLFFVALLGAASVVSAQEQPKDSLGSDEGLEEVVIKSTRTSRTIRNTPTRVETIDSEELDEKANMRPANVSMVLHESTGIQVQQTSATSGNSSIRVQGLDGRYTQLLKDGYPNFGNFANGLSILEIPPLDLKQVEVIKGPASTLYGGGAIAGVVNFISKDPSREGEHLLLLNQSHVGQSNLGGFFSKRNDKWGYTLLGLANLQNDYDVDRDGFSELPQSFNLSLHPKVFWYKGEKTSFELGNQYAVSRNTGGDTRVIDHREDAFHTYFERNITLRNTTNAELQTTLGAGTFRLRGSLAVFIREIELPDYKFTGNNLTGFGEATWSATFRERHDLVVGASYNDDRFDQRTNTSGHNLDSHTATAGVFAQHTWDITDQLILESGLRAETVRYVMQAGTSQRFGAVLPRVSLLYKFHENWSGRVTGGTGYKAPTVFTEQTETLQYRDVLPLVDAKVERSAGGTVDVNYRVRPGEWAISANQMFFYTRLTRPLVLQYDGADYRFVNASDPVRSRGFETNLKFVYQDYYKLFAGYTFTEATAGYVPGAGQLPLVPRHKVNLTLIYEKERDLKIGLEGYFTDQQYLTDRTATPSYWELGASAEKYFGKHLSIFVNFENFTDERQGRYKRVVNGPATQPTFDEIWNHTEGFVCSGGVKWRW